MRVLTDPVDTSSTTALYTDIQRLKDQIPGQSITDLAGGELGSVSERKSDGSTAQQALRRIPRWAAIGPTTLLRLIRYRRPGHWPETADERERIAADLGDGLARAMLQHSSSARAAQTHTTVISERPGRTPTAASTRRSSDTGGGRGSTSVTSSSRRWDSAAREDGATRADARQALRSPSSSSSPF
jgi:hypothetical protein